MSLGALGPRTFRSHWPLMLPKRADRLGEMIPDSLVSCDCRIGVGLCWSGARSAAVKAHGWRERASGSCNGAVLVDRYGTW